jgi:hypothetical protein
LSVSNLIFIGKLGLQYFIIDNQRVFDATQLQKNGIANLVFAVTSHILYFVVDMVSQITAFILKVVVEDVVCVFQSTHHVTVKSQTGYHQVIVA